MDERHWWFSSKIFQTLNIGIYDDATLLEDFMSSDETLELLNDFFKPNGVKIVFFYLSKNDGLGEKARKTIQTGTSSSVNIHKLLNDIHICVYFIHENIEQEIDVQNIENEVLSGEIKQNGLTLYNDIFKCIFLPLMKNKKNWSAAENLECTYFYSELEKFSQTLEEYSNANSTPEQILKVPNGLVVNSFQKNRQIAFSPQVVIEYEEMVMNWVRVIEDVLVDSLDERYDLYTSPMAILFEWRRRQKNIQSIIDQLKSKEIKSVIAALISAKSKVLKHWKTIDAGLTDAFNDVKDRNKYLESLQSSFEQLQHESSLFQLSCNVLPDLLSGIRQLDSVSRFFAKNGFLGSLLAKVCHQLIVSCKHNIVKFISSQENKKKNIDEKFWDCITKEIIHGKVRTEKNRLKRKITNDQLNSLLSALYNTLSVCHQYKELYYSLKDAMGGSQYTPTLTSASMLSKKLKHESSTSSGGTAVSETSKKATEDDLSTDKLSGNTSSASASGFVYGVPLSDEKTILNPLIFFVQHLHQLVDVIETLKQVHALVMSTKTAPQLSEAHVDKTSENVNNSDGNDRIDDSFSDTLVTSRSSDLLEVEDVISVNLSRSISEVFQNIKQYLQSNLKLNILDVQNFGEGDFDNVYTDFVRSIQKIESLIEQYIKTFNKLNSSTEQSLTILSCFTPIFSRTALSTTFQNSYAIVLQSYEQDLANIEKQYELNKDCPPSLRNVPIVSSAIIWVKRLFQKIETPMKILKDVKFVTNLKEYKNAVKYYNRLATVLIQFEDSWLSVWTRQAELCLKSINTTLLAQEVENKKIIVYSDPRILEIFADVKRLKRFDFVIPENILEIYSKENRYKFYKETLEHLLAQFYAINDAIPYHLKAICGPLLESTLSYFQPGLSVLYWNSVNVDAFLHKVQSAINHSKTLIDKVTKICYNEVDTAVEKIKIFILFDKSAACSKLWSPMDFIQMHNCSIDEIGLSLSQLIHLIEKSLQEIAITLTKKPDSLPTFHATNITSKSAEGYAVSLLAADQQEPTSPISFLNDKKVISDLFAHYSSDIFKAVLKSTLQSLEEYYELVGRERNDMRQSLKFKVNVLFDLPNIVLVPTINTVQSVVSQIAQNIIDVSLNIYWWDADFKKSFHDTIMNNSSVVLLKEKIDNALNNLERDVTSFLLAFENYNFLWLDDMNTLYTLLEEEKPDLESHHVEVQRLVKIERNIQNIANQVNIGSIVLETTPIKESLSGFCLAWKMCYVQKLHHVAKDNLDMVVAQRENFNSHLTSEINSLSDLNNVLNEIQRITDMEIRIDNLYAPVESLYDVLTSGYGVPIARKEIEAVKCLRICWSNLVVLAETLREKLMKEQRTIFEEELDRDIKAFVLEVIQFRNRFDSQGLAMPGIVPTDAVAKLKEFQKDYSVFNERSETLHAVQQWFGITPTPFDELKKTGEELELLGMLYELFQRFISFDMKFRDTLWADVYLEDSCNDIKTIWNCFMSLPAKIHNWFAFIELQDALNGYLEIFPLLHKLASKEIRNRHWLQVMHVTKKSFQLEANIFKLNHIMDIGLIEHKSEIEQIVKGSQVELDLESCLRRIEETWADQVFQFERYKSRGLMIFNKDHMDHLLDTLEEGKSSLITMLASKYIKPLKEETAAWSIKLNEVGEMLEQWLNVEKMWTNLEPVFNSENAVKEVEKQHSDFAKADQSYIKLMKKAANVSNVVQCCLSGEVCNITMLKQINKDLELCFKSLDDYLNQKRKVFPRFNLISNQVLLAMLSKPHNLDSILPYIREVIPGVHNVETVIDSSSCLTSELINPAVENPISNDKERSSVAVTHFVTINQTERFSIQEDVDNHPTFLNGATNASCLPDSKWKNNIPTIDITSVSDAYGEKLTLQNKVTLKGQVEEWLSTLLCEIKHTVHGSLLTFIKSINNDIIIDDLIINFPCQVTLMGLLYYWTKECEQSISDVRIDRKSLTNFAKKISNMANRFSQILIRGSSKSSGIHVSNVQQIRMESITGMIIYLRDVFDHLVNNKLRGISDFEWKQTIKCYYSHTDKEQHDLHIHMLDKKFHYQNEFLGCKFSLIMSPFTERCLLNLGQAVVDRKAGCVSGPDLVGKTEIIRGLSNLLGQYLFSISCTTNLSAHSLQRIFVGVAEDGCWCCFTNLQCLSQKRFILLHNLTHTVLNCLRNKNEIASIGNIGEVKVADTCRIFFTSSLPFIHKSCPASFKAMLRNVSLAHPDISAILRLQLIAHGFKCAKILASKITLAAEICQDQLKLKNHFSLSALSTIIKRGAQKQQNYSASMLLSDGYLPRIEDTALSVGTFAQAGTAKGMFRVNKSPIPGGVRTTSVKGRSSAIPHVISETMKIEYAVIAQSLSEIIGARLCDQESIIFKSVLESLFGEYENLTINLQLEEELLSCIVDVAKEKCLTTSKKFVDKVMQLYYVSQVNHAVAVCGPSSSGKSTCVSILIEALKKMFSRKNTSCSYKHDHVNILATSDLNFMFGFTNDFGDWVDGVVPNLLKKAGQNFSRHTCSTWITLDGPLHDYWCYKLKALIGQEKVSIKPDLERIYLSKNVKLCFETDNLSDASPTIFASMGILYVDSAVVGWRAIADAWLASRPSQQYHTLQRAFNKIVDRIVLFVQEEAQMCIQLSDCTLMSSCLSMLSSLLKERTDISGDLHIERLFLFATIWVFGGLLVYDLDKKEFNSLLLSLTNALPDDDDGISVFDYYVDEAGEWDAWNTRLNEAGITDSIDMFGDVFVDTVETVQTKFLLDLLMSNGNNTLLVGSRCAGKSSLVESFLQKQSDKNCVLRKVAFTNATHATFLQQYLDGSLYHRQGFRYGMRNNKILKLCIDDLHLPNYDICNQQSANQLLRQLMDRNIIYTNGSQCTQKYIEGFHVIATMNPFTKKANKPKYSQLLGKFCTVHMPLLSEKQIYSITTTLLEANMTLDQGLSLPQSLHDQIVNVSTKLLVNTCKMLNSSNSDLQFPYLFNVGDLSRVFQILQQCPEELRVDEDNKYFQTFWHHETKHVFLDRISKKKDIDWFNETLNDILVKDFSLQLKDNPIFTTFSPDAHLRNQRQLNANKQQRKQVAFHQRLTTVTDVKECLESFVYRYVSEKNEQLDLILHDFNSRQIIKTHRILSCGNRGNMIAVTGEVEQMNAIVKLSIFMLGYHQQIIDCSSTTSFLQGLRMVARMAGCDQENVCIILKARDINTSFSLEALHSLMSLGEYAPLFSDAELNSLLAALRPTIKKVNSRLLSEPKRFFTSSIKKNLHVVIITSPEENFLPFLQSKYPAILSNSYVNWLPEDSLSRLHNEELSYLSTADFWHDYEETLKDKVLKTLQDVHFVFTKKSKRNDVIQKDSSLKQSDMLRNKILSSLSDSQHSSYNVPTFKKFLKCFKYIMENRVDELQNKTKTRRLALECLAIADEKAVAMSKEKNTMTQQYEVLEKETKRLCEELFTKSSLIERLKAKYGTTTSSFCAFMALIDSEMVDSDDELTWDDDHDELDEEYERIQSTSRERLKSLGEQVDEMSNTVELLEKEMESAKEMLNSFQIQIDRGCIERLRAYQSPPTLVGTIMVMVMILLRRPEFSSYVTASARTEKYRDGNLLVSESSLSRTSSAKSKKSKTPTQPAISKDGKVDRKIWKTIQQIMQDSQKFCELMNTYNWCEGVSDDVMNTVVSFFAPGEEIPLITRQDPVTPNKSDAGISLQAARFSSEDAAQIVEYVQKVIYFTRKYKPYIRTKNQLNKLKVQKKEKEEKLMQANLKEENEKLKSVPVEIDALEGLNEEDIATLQLELATLQQQFDECSMSKHKLQEKILMFSNLLDNTTTLLNSMKPFQDSWLLFCDTFCDASRIITDGILSSTYSCYCGILNADARYDAIHDVLSVCSKNRLSHKDQNAVKQISLVSFLNKEIDIMEFSLMYPSADKMLVDLFCMTKQKDCINGWPLLCDPCNVGVFLLKKMFPNIIVIYFTELDLMLEDALQQGSHVVVTDVNVKGLESNATMLSLLECYYLFQSSNTVFKIMIGGKEVECSPKFRLFLSCTSDSDEVPLSIVSLVHCMQITIKRDILYDIFLSRFMTKEKPQIETSFHFIIKEILDEKKSILVLEEQLLDMLANKKCFSDISSIKKLSNTMKLLEDSTNSLSRAEEVYRTVKQSRDVYSLIAMQAAVLFQVAGVMRKVKPFYRVSIDQFLSYFDVAIKHSDRSAVSRIADKVLSALFYISSKSKLEVDRPLFALLTALEVEDSHGRLSVGDREFLISSHYGSTLKQSVLDGDNSSNNIALKTSSKKLFDWMSDEQYQNLLNLSQNYGWFSESFEKMTKDGREMQWRLISEHDTPELLALPDNVDEKYSPLQRFMVMRAFRDDRFMQAANTFVAMVLGKKLAFDGILDLKLFLHHSSPTSPILVLYDKDPMLCDLFLTELATSKEVKLLIHHVSEDSEDVVETKLSQAMSKGCWLFLNDIHHKQSLMESLFTCMKKYHADSGFRLWLSGEITDKFPVKFLHSCLPVIIDAPKLNLHKSFLQNLHLVTNDMLKTGMRSDVMLIHNTCLLHSCLLQRWKCAGFAVTHLEEFQFDISKLLETSKVVSNECHTESADVSTVQPTNKGIQWSSIRMLLSKMVYGREVTNPVDLNALNALIEFWISLNATRKDFEITRARFKLPSVLLTNNTKPSAVLQAVENMPNSSYDSMEFAGLFQTQEVPASSTLYTLSNLKHLYDNMPATETLVHLDPGFLYMRGIDASQLVVFPFGSTFNAFTCEALIRSKQIELSEVLSTALLKLPRLWSKEFVSERIRKTGGLTTYNMWLLAEADAICVLHHTIKNSIQKLQEALNTSSTCCNLSQELVDDAIDLYAGEIPRIWYQNAGPSAPPRSWNIISWITDFQNRCSHVERILLQGRDKVAGYWLAAFFNPKRLLSVIIQESAQNLKFLDASSEGLVVKTEITNRDKDHLRDPPSDGIFIYGVHLWGTHWEKASNDLHDNPPKSISYALPVIHFQVVPRSEKGTCYTCPCYVSTQHTKESVFCVDVEHKDASKYALRAVTCTLRPF